MFLRKILAFIKRDLRQETSYRFSFFMQIFGIFVSASTFFFLSKLFGKNVNPSLSRYGGDYFSFVLIGIAFSSYLEVALRGFSQKIREAQMLGTLEALLVTQTDIPTIIFSSSLYSFIFASFRVVLYLIFGVFIYGLNLSNANYSAAFLILLISIPAFCSFGILSASFIMVLKKGDPIARIFSWINWLLGGVYYPVSILPTWLKGFSYLLPITYSLEGMRLALLQGHSIIRLYPHILALLGFSLVLLPITLYLFIYAVKRAKRDGSLLHY